MDKGSGRALNEAGPEIIASATGGEHHHGRLVEGAHLVGNGEAVDIREHDVEQDDIGLQVHRRPKTSGTVGCLAHDENLLRLEQESGGMAELDMVVDDQDGHRHALMVPRCRGDHHQGKSLNEIEPGWVDRRANCLHPHEPAPGAAGAGQMGTGGWVPKTGMPLMRPTGPSVRVRSSRGTGPRRRPERHYSHERHPTRIARLTAASALVLDLGALGVGPALADDASPDTIGRGSGIRSVEDGAGAEWYLSADDEATTNGAIQSI